MLIFLKTLLFYLFKTNISLVYSEKEKVYEKKIIFCITFYNLHNNNIYHSL